MNKQKIELPFYCGQPAGFQNNVSEPVRRFFLELEIFSG
jgi:hypothetical protein